MERKTLIWIIAICLVIVVIAAVCVISALRNGPHKAFPTLKAEDVAAVEVTFGAYPPYPMTGEDQASLVTPLQQIEVTRETDEYQDYDGITSQMFVLYLPDGTEIGLGAGNPFFFVDGQGYWCEVSAAEEIQALYTAYIPLIQGEAE